MKRREERKRFKMDINNAPLVKALMEYVKQGTIRFHMPGHKGGKAFPKEFLDNLAAGDVTEIPGMDNLYCPAGVIAQAQMLAAKAFGAHHTFFMVNGSTAGIQAMIMAACKPGDKLIVPRNSHRSVWAAMILADVKPVYIQPRYDQENFMATQILVQDVQRALDENPDAVGVLVVHPNYYGMCSHLKQIERVVHGRGKLLLVDEAHGAHFIFHPDLPPSAGELGADMWVQSAHKTLPALTQAAYLHVKGPRVDAKRVAQVIAMLQTSSPSYLIMASLDWARALMEAEGKALIERLMQEIHYAKARLRSHIGLLTINDYDKGEEVEALDPTRLVLDVRPLGITGYRAEKLLREAGVQVEMSDIYRLVLICSVADDRATFKALVERLTNLIEKLPGHRLGPRAEYNKMSISQEIPQQMMSPREAFYSIIENIPIRESVGRICAGIIGAYPPGVPRFCPGELIDKEGIDELLNIQRYGGTLFGLVKNSLVPVVSE
ncbi:aminotransferase class I/II-fold pyridoxal phosphate-dependent enzyme [Caldicoprobacter algeriensis]|uniref:aminotransferase class I/II-fold pyridoxal phosphate-dependent enzyme n=1 Tax=Caldicoprobacter algeriensis TaxID=699281 RepID=UPI00207ADAD2|nr:aminotransferase class I/II-fold pyridoxal phosphate-dependent enzyme [Caldicoprobacter algeriensis]MCM8901862.1 aminotransferase class I/II-fold pyridoxal phosphate-dependent enzyme [Caldicoprobacter algeriensis]